MAAADSIRALSADYVRSILEYDSETGTLTWRVRRAQRSPAGALAGSVNSKTGYRVVRVDGRIFLAHRLIWLLVTGAMPAEVVDHRNGARADNRWTNLRACSQQENCANRKTRRDSSTGVANVRTRRVPRGIVYDVIVTWKGVSQGEYGFDSLADASIAADSLRVLMQGEFAKHLGSNSTLA